MKQKVQFVEAGGNEWPLCPHCKKELRQMMFRKRGWLAVLTVFWCPHCKCLLGTSHAFNG
jgi:hypothetical protein